MTKAADAFAVAREAAAAFGPHDVALVLGSGWSPAADRLGPVESETARSDVPGFPAATVLGHGATIRSIVTDEGRRILAFMGRVHGYEGHPPDVVVHGVRAAVLAGCRVVVVTNAAGGLRTGLHVGQPLLISDHLNLTGRSPVAGTMPSDVPIRFVDLTDAYSSRLRALTREVDPSLEEGVYAGLPGPHYETPAEIRMLQTLGADLVGMSTVWETIAARHLGAEVLGLSLVTNLAAGLGEGTLDHEEVLEAGRASAERMGDLLASVVRRL